MRSTLRLRRQACKREMNWNRVTYFKREEFQDPDHGPESGDLIDGRLVFMLDRLRDETGWPVITNWAVGGAVDVNGTHGHAKGSYHLAKKGCKAVDFHFRTDAPLRYQYYLVSKAEFVGIGIYPDWEPCVGFHVDLRPMELTQRWIRRNGEYFYLLP